MQLRTGRIRLAGVGLQEILEGSALPPPSAPELLALQVGSACLWGGGGGGVRPFGKGRAARRDHGGMPPSLNAMDDL